jgi:hypothetical protein
MTAIHARPTRERIAVMAACLSLAAGLFARALPHSGQDGGLPPPKDTIFARKILMGAIDMNMDEIETMLTPGGKFEPTEAVEHADTISIMLLSFPHLFPAQHQPVATKRRSRSGDGHGGLARAVAQFCGFLSARADRIKAWARCGARQNGNEFKALIVQLRAALQRLPRGLYENRIKQPDLAALRKRPFRRRPTFSSTPPAPPD